MKLSILIPVYNEEATILKILEKINNSAPNCEKEIIIVDDGSEDNTADILKNINNNDVKVIFSEKNQGKGAAINIALKYATGDVVIIQDADLEYDPKDYDKLIGPIAQGEAEVVFGSRFLEKSNKFMFKQLIANKFLTFFTNILFFSHLTDMETCYKVFSKKALEGIEIKSKKFDLEPEITAKILKKKLSIKELPISFDGRDYSQGKKIKMKDGLLAICAILKYRFGD